MNEQKFLNLAALSKIDFSEVEQAKFIEDLDNIISFIGKVKDFDGEYDDTADNRQVIYSDLREDVMASTANPEQLLSNTNSQNNCYIIPRVID